MTEMKSKILNGWEEIFQNFLESSKNSIEEALKDYFDSKARIGTKNSPSQKLQDVVSLQINGTEFFGQCTIIANILAKSPKYILELLDEHLNKFKMKFQHWFPNEKLPMMRLRFNVLPALKEFQRVRIPECSDVGHIVQITGTVIKVNNPRIVCSRKAYVCGACKKVSISPADPTQFNLIPPLTKCLKCGGKGQMKLESKEDDSSLSMTKDSQEIKVQEKRTNMRMGTMAKSIMVVLEEDLVGQCNPGDDVQVVGIVFQRWHSLGKGPGGTTDIELAIEANHLEVLNIQQRCQRLTIEEKKYILDFWDEHKSSELEGRNHILQSFCPQVYGLYQIKLAVCIILCGGVEVKDPSGTKIRGESHILLVGDPGTGKSQILRYAAKLTPKSILTSGIGSTKAGLTVSAVRDGNNWALEPGALVLADGGVCCIDEFGTIKQQDKVAIHEAMEQQCLSVAKAGVVTSFKTRCSIIATANPNGSYDPENSMSVNINIGSPLLSRFDLIFLLLDAKNEEWDKHVTSHLLGLKLDENEPSSSNGKQEKRIWNLEKLKMYFAYCRQLEIDMSPDASNVISRYYIRQRNHALTENLPRTTTRLLHSLIRLAEGHAKLMNHALVTIMDTINAIILVELSYNSNPTFLPETTNPLHISFPEDVEEEYKFQAEKILTALDLGDLWEKEKQRLKQLTMIKSQDSESQKVPRPQEIVDNVVSKKRKRPSF